MKNNRHPELLLPAGNFEKMKAAIRYGADAVYLAGESFGMRAAADNFTEDELRSAIAYAHERGVKVYVTLNVLLRDNAYPALEAFVRLLSELHADAVIVADLGILSLVKRVAPDMELHISTQASAVSAAACNAWHELGAKRVVLARELTLEEIKTIRRNISPELELEAFIHGSMCIAYSGRCLMSDYFTGRSANVGACTQPCRWQYKARELIVEEVKRIGQPIPVIDSGDGGTFVMSSRDLCMIEHIPELYESGIDSFKIEGRIKSAYYAAITANTYKYAMQRYEEDPSGYVYDPRLREELEGVSHREYDTGFFFEPPYKNAKCVSDLGYLREKAYLATAIESGSAGEKVTFIQRNKLFSGDKVELISPGKLGRSLRIEELCDVDGSPIEATPHPNMLFTIKAPFDICEGDILRG